MVITVNQMLVAFLILELVVFLVFIGMLAVKAIGTLKKVNVLVNNVNDTVTTTKSIVKDCGDKAKDAALTVVDNASPIAKTAGAVAIGFVVINSMWLIRRRFLMRSGVVESYLGHRSKKRTEKELIKAKKEISQMRKQAKRRAKTDKKARKLAKKIK